MTRDLEFHWSNLSPEWMTDSLLEKMEKHPLLSRALRDPTLARALAQFQTDPESVLRTAASNPQLQQILREFCAVMGSHFTELADKQDSEKHGERMLSYSQFLLPFTLVLEFNLAIWWHIYRS